MSLVNIIISHVGIIMLHDNISKSPVNIFILHVDIIYLASWRQKYAIIQKSS